MEPYDLLFAIIALFLVGLGIAVGLVACAAGSALVGTGVVSTSVLFGFWKRRTLAGVRVFFLQCGILLGAPAGAALAWVAWHVWPLINSEWRVLAAGAMGGAIAGLLMAWLASATATVIAQQAWPWLKGRVTVLYGGSAQG